MIVALGEDFHFYSCRVDSGAFQAITGMTAPDGKVSFANYRLNGTDVLLVALASGGLYVYDGSQATFYEDAPALSSICIHYDRLYGSDGGDTIRFSNALDPTDFEISGSGGAGYISLPDGGRIIKVLSWKDYLFIFREHGVSRLTAYADPSDYKVVKVFEADYTIIEGTIAASDAGIFFLAGGALYLFDGYSVKRIEDKLTALVSEGAKARGAVFKNRYYLSARIKPYEQETIGEEATIGVHENNALIVLGISDSFRAVMRGADIGPMTTLTTSDGGFLLCTFLNARRALIGLIDDSGKVYGTPLKKLWISPRCSFKRNDEKKALRRIYLDTPYPLSFTAGSESENKSDRVAGGSSPQVLAYRISGDALYFKIESEEANFKVNGVTAELDFNKKYI
jgi:hypothetical protein